MRRDWKNAKQGEKDTDHFRQSAHADQRRHWREEIDKMLLSALASGEAVEITSEWREERREQLARQIKARKLKS